MNTPTPGPDDDRSSQPDVDSDPAQGGEGQTDWSAEGGATPDGPAGDTDAS